MNMKKILITSAIAVAFSTGFAFSASNKKSGDVQATSSTAPICAEGHITCAEWCSRKGGPFCMSGGIGSCDTKPQGINTCVRANYRFHPTYRMARPFDCTIQHR